MALAESTTIAYGGKQLESTHQPLQPQSEHDQELLQDQSSTMTKQNSILSLTLDEIQLKSGKSFGSMNMDEFLTNLWNVEDNQISMEPNRIEPINEKAVIENQPTLTRQNSFSIPIRICKKTVEEVWSEIRKDQPLHQKLNNIDRAPPQRQQTFGEMTLEEFLIKAGVVQEPTRPPAPQKMVQPIQSNNLDANNYGMGHMMALGFSTQPNMGSNLLVNGYAPYPIYTQAKSIVGDLSSNVESEKNHSIIVEACGTKINKKRTIDGPPEVVVERRQRRMIKNRESAARSRARKQAYTVELELELNQLREENEKLKQVVKEFEEKRLKEILKRMKQSTMARKKAEKLRTIKRTASSTW